MELLKRLETYAVERPEHIAIRMDDVTLTYETLWRDVQKESEALPTNISHQNVMLTHTQTLDFIVAYLATLVRQGVPCVLGPQWSTEQRDALIKLHRMPYVWGDEGLTSTSHEPAHKAPMIPQCLHIGFTSGTTGLPKGFMRDLPSWIASFEVNDTLLDASTQTYMALAVRMLIR